VGESGCGKTTAALSIMRLIPPAVAKTTADKLCLTGKDLLSLKEKEMAKIRGKEMAMVFQEPLSSLNPVFTIGSQVAETLLIHQGLNKKQAGEKALELLKLVRFPSPRKNFSDYPHQLSGGMRQRALIAMALACSPALLIADEPTTSLDVTIQAQILDLLAKLQKEMGMAVLIISHNLGIIAELAKKVIVMYAGVAVEEAAVSDLYNEPLHPYTMGLMASMPRLNLETGRLKAIPGSVPDPLKLMPGCRFHPRCPYASNLCREKEPPLVAAGERKVRCWLYGKEENI
ncbi:MAG TPA: ABC transporter ATP-binding protein, partial [Firmicutes bacterium]|nr:ABC transporter ATP-binding protein [Bacillota bacterium]